mgnify:CR=1 FL=1
MGLIFVMPVSKKETDHVSVKEEAGLSPTLLLKSYGLPYIFWAYIAAIFVTIFIMYLAVRAPLIKMGKSEDIINLLIYYSVWVTFISIPSFLLAGLFYEKSFIKSGKNLVIKHKIMGLGLRTKKLILKEKDSFSVTHHLDSPNVARKKRLESMRAFQNQGYYTLRAHVAKKDKIIIIDRNGRKADLKKIEGLLSEY